jgi:hypothetical protein
MGDNILDKILEDNPEAKVFTIADGDVTPKRVEDGKEQKENIEDKAPAENPEGAEGAEGAEKPEEKEVVADPIRDRIKALVGGEVETPDQIDAWYNSIITERDAEKKKYEDMVAALSGENQTLKDLYDPKKIFASDAEYKRQMLLRQFPDYKPEAIGQLLKHEDVNNMSPIEALRCRMALEDGDIYESESDIMSALEDKYGVSLEDGLSDIEGVVKNRVLKDAKEAKKYFKDMLSKVDDKGLPDILSEREKADTHRATLKDEWAKVIPTLAKNMDKIKVPIQTDEGNSVYEYVIDDKYRADIAEKAKDLAEYFASTGAELTKEGLSTVTDMLTTSYLKANLSKILHTYAQDKVAAYVEKQAKEAANIKDDKGRDELPDRKMSTDEQKKATAEQMILSDLGTPFRI